MLKGFHRLHALRMENDAARFEMEGKRARFDRIAGTEVKAVSAWQLFQTPPELARKVCEGVREGERVLEPSAGLGRLLDCLPGSCEAVAVEVAPELAGELYKREGVKLLQRDFLSVSPEETGLFDRVVMNPPFHMRADIRHVKHALSFLKEGGTLSAICMDTRHRRDALIGLAFDWEPLPRGSFRSEGTDVPTLLIRIQK